ncbi:MAG TPA: hypothetical protein VF132_01650, partial [Rudaea sp.]
SSLSLAFGSDDTPAATYLRTGNGASTSTYAISRCSDASCTNVTTTQIAAPVGASTPFRTALAVRSGQRPLALDSQSQNRALLDCTTSACTTSNNVLLPAAAAGLPVGLQLLANDRPSFALFGNLTAGAFACADATCTSGAAVQIATTTSTIRDADYALANGPSPTLAYIDDATGKLGFAECRVDQIFANGFDVVP